MLTKSKRNMMTLFVCCDDIDKRQIIAGNRTAEDTTQKDHFRRKRAVDRRKTTASLTSNNFNLSLHLRNA